MVAKRSLRQAIDKAKQVFNADLVIVDSNADDCLTGSGDFVWADEMEAEVYSD